MDNISKLQKAFNVKWVGKYSIQISEKGFIVKYIGFGVNRYAIKSRTLSVLQFLGGTQFYEIELLKDIIDLEAKLRSSQCQ